MEKRIPLNRTILLNNNVLQQQRRIWTRTISLTASRRNTKRPPKCTNNNNWKILIIPYSCVFTEHALSNKRDWINVWHKNKLDSNKPNTNKLCIIHQETVLETSELKTTTDKKKVSKWKQPELPVRRGTSESRALYTPGPCIIYKQQSRLWRSGAWIIN